MGSRPRHPLRAFATALRRLAVFPQAQRRYPVRLPRAYGSHSRRSGLMGFPRCTLHQWLRRAVYITGRDGTTAVFRRGPRSKCRPVHAPEAVRCLVSTHRRAHRPERSTAICTTSRNARSGLELSHASLEREAGQSCDPKVSKIDLHYLSPSRNARRPSANAFTLSSPLPLAASKASEV